MDSAYGKGSWDFLLCMIGHLPHWKSPLVYLGQQWSMAKYSGIQVLGNFEEVPQLVVDQTQDLDHTGIFILYVRHNEYIYASINLMEAFWCSALDKQGHLLQTLTLFRSGGSIMSVSWDAQITEEQNFLLLPRTKHLYGCQQVMRDSKTQSSGHFTSGVLDLFWSVTPF